MNEHVAAVERLAGDVQRLRSELRSAEEALKAAQAAVLPFLIGDVVEARTSKGWVTAIVRDVQPWSSGSGWYSVALRRKDGEWSKTRRGVGARDLRKPEDVA